jgi:hypothetical protein
MAETRKLTCAHCGAVVFTARPKVTSCPSCGTEYAKDAATSEADHLSAGVMPNLRADIDAATAEVARTGGVALAGPLVTPPTAAPAAEAVDGKPAATPAKTARARKR